MPSLQSFLLSSLVQLFLSCLDLSDCSSPGQLLCSPLGKVTHIMQVMGDLLLQPCFGWQCQLVDCPLMGLGRCLVELLQLPAVGKHLTAYTEQSCYMTQPGSCLIFILAEVFSSRSLPCGKHSCQKSILVPALLTDPRDLFAAAASNYSC